MSGQVHGSPPFRKVPERFLFSDLSDRAVRLLLVLDRYASQGRGSYPGRPKLAESLRCSVDTVDRTIAELVAAGALTVSHEARPGGGHPIPHYWLWPATPPEQDRTAAVSTPEETPSPPRQDRTHAASTPEQSRTGAVSKPHGCGIDPPDTFLLERERSTQRKTAAIPSVTLAAVPGPLAATPRPCDDPVKVIAHSLTLRAFERDRKPTCPFVAVLGMLKTLIASGYPESELADLLSDPAPFPWTKGGLEVALSRRAASRPRGDQTFAMIRTLWAKEAAR